MPRMDTRIALVLVVAGLAACTSGGGSGGSGTDGTDTNGSSGSGADGSGDGSTGDDGTGDDGTGEDGSTGDDGSTGTDGTDGTTPALPCEGVKTGVHVGDCGPDFTLLDSTGAPISLYDYAGEVILLDLSGFG